MKMLKNTLPIVSEVQLLHLKLILNVSNFIFFQFSFQAISSSSSSKLLLQDWNNQADFLLQQNIRAMTKRQIISWSCKKRILLKKLLLLKGIKPTERNIQKMILEAFTDWHACKPFSPPHNNICELCHSVID
jgi:Na+/pantothenate symporter